MSAGRQNARRAVALAIAALVVVLAALTARELAAPPRKPVAAARVVAPAATAPIEDAAAVVAEGAAAIRGHILDESGNAVGGASVRVVSPRAPHEVIAEATSDGSGAFSFARVPPRPVRVTADRDPTGAVTSAELVPSEGRTLELTLVLSATSGVRGTVVGADDRPVAGATVAVEGIPWSVPAATSDATGAFRLRVVPSEATSLVAAARGYDATHVAIPPRDDGAEVAIRVVLVAAHDVLGDVRGSDGDPVRADVVACAGQPFVARTTSADDGTFTLPASALGCDAVATRIDAAQSDPVALVAGRRALLRLKAGGSIEGVVVDDRAAGVPSYALGIESFVPAGSAVFGRTATRTLSDPHGAFVLDRLAPGRYVLAVSAPDRPITKSAPIDVAAATATRGVRILLARGGVVQGRVVDDRRAPVAGVDVRFDALSSVVESTAHATTDADGRFRIEGAPSGPFTVRVQKDGFRTRLVTGLRVESGGTLARDVSLSALNGGAGQELGGIGAGPVETPDGVELRAVFAGNPAERAGLRPGDRVVSIDGEPCEGMPLVDVMQRLRGEPGTTVGVSALRPSTGETVDVVIVRGEIVR